MDHPLRATDEAGLLARVADGDEAALNALILRHGRGIRLLAARYLDDMQLAEDIAQETFLRVWRHAGRYDPNRGAVSTWIYRIATNLCTDRHRRRRFARALGLEPGPEESPDDLTAGPWADAEQTLAGRQQLARVREAMTDLPERQRMALLLSAVAGMDNPAIAAAMGTSRGSVEQLLVRARRTLRDRTHSGEIRE
ncbi:RNA polymerase sigma factor [Maritimibacter alkaliphilus]|uniref:RNA polymerase sigma factor n=1 Tax=Maritimibacter alkaliphilus TaxID=404236 RepID=UPI001C977E6F|nr:sigma-70 family RNA polymerase sigma factor [Maritimibacter alkaliphilus]MBY6090179.1 sigma-70 family RNA polymerase sigma factor [Maritimibacter alkaliphilus]